MFDFALTKQAAFTGPLVPLHYEPKPRRIYADAELLSLPVGMKVTFDIEAYSNYFLAAFRDITNNAYFYVEMSPDAGLLKDKLSWIMHRFCLIGFNSNDFDIPVIEAAMRSSTTQEIKTVVDDIIYNDNLRKYRQHASKLKYNHIDLIQVAPLQGSLKLYAARLHSPRIQEMQVDPSLPLTRQEAEQTREYCFNDLDCTELLLRGLADSIKLREQLSTQYNVDFRSKSDAQIAETIIASEYKKVSGQHARRPKEIDNTPFKYVPPAYMNFQTPLLQQTLETILDLEFTLDAKGYVNLPDALKGLKLNIGDACYRLSIGGLHSSETSVAYKAGDAIIDVDVASYYPRILIDSGHEPEQLRGHFTKLYSGIVERRIEYKRLKDPFADGLKIAINGTFGKLGNFYSIVCGPSHMLYITLTGQLSLLMLIEAATLIGIKIISANTDGVVFTCPHDRVADLSAVVKAWERQTGFVTEETRYNGYFARDVNNYFALKENGECKAKGAYSERGSALNSIVSKNPQALICSDAVKAFLSKGVPIEQTIRGCRDIRRFVSLRNVKGGARKDNVYLGKVVRWYYSVNSFSCIHYILSGNKVPNTEGAMPLMEMCDYIPNDLNIDWYVQRAHAILSEIGLGVRQQTLI